MTEGGCNVIYEPEDYCGQSEGGSKAKTERQLGSRGKHIGQEA